MTHSKELLHKYQEKINTPSDINKLLPILRKYAEKSNHITEMGVRDCNSTYALMMGLPNKLISYDIISIEQHGIPINWLKDLNKENGIDFEFIIADTTKIEIEPTDFLFIDTWHVYEQIKKELNLHAHKVRKYIAFHDTHTFKFNGETLGHVGLWPAITEFLDENDNWGIIENTEESNGLTVIERK